MAEQDQPVTSSGRRIAFYGGSFDPPHLGHLAVAHRLLNDFGLDEFFFIPAFHAPHKPHKKPTSAYDRFAMLCLITQNEPKICVSRMEIEMPERPYSVETLTRLVTERPNDEIFFVMGADSWMDITAWREWETVLALTNHIVVTRPGYKISFDHVPAAVRARVTDLRDGGDASSAGDVEELRIYVTDAVEMDISATEIRTKISVGDPEWHEEVPAEVANYIEKYQIYS